MKGFTNQIKFMLSRTGNIILMLLYLLIVTIMVSGCLTNENIEASKLDEESQTIIHLVEEGFIKFRVNSDSNKLKEAYSNIEILMKRAKNNRLFESKVFGLLAEYYLLQNNIPMAKQITEKIEEKNRNEEYLFLMMIQLAANDSERIELIEQAYNRCQSTGRIKLLNAELEYNKKK